MLGELTLWRDLIHPTTSNRSLSRSGMPFAAGSGSCASSAGSCGRTGKSGGLDRRQMIYDESGMLLYVDGLCMDISEQKRAEEERRLLAAAVECAADASMVTDAEWIVRYVNPLREGHGVREGGSPREESVSPRRGRGNIRAYLEIKDKVRSGSPWKGRLKNRRKDGVHLELDIVISPIRGPGGKIVNHVVALRDITGKPAREAGPCGAAHGSGRHPRRDRTRFQQRVDGDHGFADLLRMRLGRSRNCRGRGRDPESARNGLPRSRSSCFAFAVAR